MRRCLWRGAPQGWVHGRHVAVVRHEYTVAVARAVVGLIHGCAERLAVDGQVLLQQHRMFTVGEGSGVGAGGWVGEVEHVGALQPEPGTAAGGRGHLDTSSIETQ